MLSSRDAPSVARDRRQTGVLLARRIHWPNDNALSRISREKIATQRTQKGRPENRSPFLRNDLRNCFVRYGRGPTPVDPHTLLVRSTSGSRLSGSSSIRLTVFPRNA